MPLLNSQFIIFFILNLSASFIFAQEGPTRKDASAEYCVLRGDESAFILTKIIEPISSISVSKSDTIFCSGGYYSNTLTKFDYPGKKYEEGGLNSSSRVCSQMIFHNFTPPHDSTKDKYGKSCFVAVSSIFKVDFPDVQCIPPPKAGINKAKYTSSLFDNIILVNWTSNFKCGPNITTLKITYYVYITGPCPKGTKIPKTNE